MNHEERQYNKMVNTPIKRLIMSLAAPTIVSMLITSIYNLADTFFVSQLGVSASGAVGVVFPVMAIIQAVGFTLGMGGGSNISAKLGSSKNWIKCFLFCVINRFNYCSIWINLC